MKRTAELIRQAIAALFDNRLRTALSILGITIGIAAVMAVSTISKGGNHLVFSELKTFGLNSVWVYRSFRSDSPHRQARHGTGIDNQDFEAIEASANLFGIRHITPIVRADNRNLEIRNHNRYANARLLGVGRDYTSIVNDTLTRGRHFVQNDINRKLAVALIAPEAANKLFAPGVNPIGQHIRVGGKRFQVIGLLGSKSRDFLSSIGSSGGENANDRIIVPYTTLQQINGSDAIRNLQIEVAEFEQAESVAEKVKALLQRRHRNLFDYGSETMASYIKTTDRILGGVAIVGIIAASISLLVGGMGIMNMMGTSVLERTREIGIRKAVGASERDILWQFLTEAVVISIVGGILGLVLGGLASVALAYITGFPIIPSPISIIGALLVSVVVGVLSGFLPARRAANMQPVEALRSE